MEIYYIYIRSFRWRHIIILLYFHVKLLIGWETFNKNQYHPLNHETTPNTWWVLATCDIAWRRAIFPKKITTAQNFMRVRSTIDSAWRRMSVWIYGVRNTNSYIHLTWIVLKPNVMETMYLINIQYNLIIIVCTRG